MGSKSSQRTVTPLSSAARSRGGCWRHDPGASPQFHRRAARWRARARLIEKVRLVIFWAGRRSLLGGGRCRSPSWRRAGGVRDGVGAGAGEKGAAKVGDALGEGVVGGVDDRHWGTCVRAGTIE
ncbi:MAG: hypothetical protein M5U34_38575, partial [Chloroflexi bacterium]|nr:hypothetical protein [Chloroflexota bacterium]